MDIVPFEKETIKDFLDEMIKWWRNKKRSCTDDLTYMLICDCYIDAYQSIRSSLFEELLQ